MTPKKVWGVIIIVLGIFMIWNGATKCYEAELCGQEISLMDRQLSNYGGANIFNGKHLEKIFEQEKTNGIAGILIGIAMAIGGTLLLREKKNPISEPPMDDEFDENDGEWRI